MLEKNQATKELCSLEYIVIKLIKNIDLLYIVHMTFTTLDIKRNNSHPATDFSPCFSLSRLNAVVSVGT